MIVVEFTEREARAVSNTVDMMRGALDGGRDEILRAPSGEAVLEVAHSKLLHAIGVGEMVA